MNRLPGTLSGAKRPTSVCGLLIVAGLMLLNSAPAFAQSVATANPFDITRSSSYTYYQATDGVQQGLLKTETVEPNDPRLCTTTTYLYDGYGNRTGSTIAPCASAPVTSSFAPHGTSSVFAATASQSITVGGVATSVPVPGGAFQSSVSNALSQQELHTTDPRFGVSLTVTGPNSLTTSWTYDDFGRKTRELRSDGTSVVTMYCVLTGDASSNSSGCAGLTFAAGEKPTGADQFAHSEPRDASDHKMGPYQRVFLDAGGRTLRTSTQSFDGAGQPGATGGVVVQDTVYSPLGVVIVSTQPYFLSTGSSTATGSGDVGATYTQYDLLGRPVRVYQADPHGSQGSVAFASWGSRVAGLTQVKYTANSMTTTDDLGRTRTEEKDLAGNVVRITDATGAQLAHQYDAVGDLVQTKDALQNLVTITYDTRGNKLSLLDPDSGLTLYCYDALGQLKAQQTAKMRGNNTPVACPADIDSTTSAKAEAGWTTMAYDALGRLRQRAEPEDISTWSYDTYADGSACAKGVGKLCESKSSVGAGHRYAFDANGRMASSSVTTNSAGTSGFASSVSYDATTGRTATKTYPSGLQIGYAYTAGGFLKSVTLASQVTVNPLPHTVGGSPGTSAVLVSGTALWAATTVDAWGHMAADALGNGITDRTTYDPSTGRPTQIAAGAGATGTGVMNLAYAWDNIGRLQSRTDNNGAGGAVVDGYQYDGVDRLVQYVVQAPGVPGYSRTVTMQYNAIGNLLYKSDVGTYAYAAYGNTGGVTGALPHAVATVTDSLGVPTHYQYDAGGNMVSADRGKYHALSYTSFNLPDSNAGLAGNATYTYVYDENHQRIKEAHVDGTGTQVTWFANPDNAGGLAFESETSAAGVLNNRHYIAAEDQTIVLVTTGALPVLSVGQTAPTPNMTMAGVKVEYWHKDFLGNLVATTDHAGAVTAYYAYDPFGKRRTTGGAYDASGVIVASWSTTLDNGTGRGYTTHEQLDDDGLIHMNGRLFDPTIGRFLQGDPLIQSAGDLQNYNRYSYCLNNPVTCTDPSGRSFLGNLTGVNPMRSFLASFKLGDPLSYWINTKIAHNRIGYQVGSIAIAIVGTYYCGGVCVGAAEAAWAGFAGATTEQALKTGVIAGVMAEAGPAINSEFAAAGTAGATVVSVAENTLAHAALGCAMAQVQGTNCKSSLQSAVTGEIGGAFNAWVTTQTTVATPGQLTLTEAHASVTDWTQVALKVAAESTVRGLVFQAFGRSFNAGFNSVLLPDLASEVYAAYVPWQEQALGSTGAAGPKTAQNGVIVNQYLNNFGHATDGGSLSLGALDEGGWASSLLVRFVPMMGAISQVHDVWANVAAGSPLCESDACYATMLPAAMLSYTAYARQIRY